MVNPEVTKSHQIRIHIICTTPGIQVQKLKRNHSSTEDREKVCVHMQLHSQIDRLFFFLIYKQGFQGSFDSDNLVQDTNGPS